MQPHQGLFFNFDFTNNERLKNSGFALEGVTVNGYVSNGAVTVNVNSAKALNSVVGHEITHVLEGTELYSQLQTALFQYAEGKGELQSRRESLEKLYTNVQGANIDGELTADLVGDYLFADADFVRNLSTNHRNVFQKVFDEIKYLYKVATAGSKEARELEKIKKTFEKVYRETGQAQNNTAEGGGVQYSIVEDFTDNNGTRFSNAVLFDTDFFDGESPRNWGKKLRSAIQKKADNVPLIFPVLDDAGNVTILQFANPSDRVGKNGSSGHKVLDELSYTTDNISKLAVVHIDEIVSVSEESSPYYSRENNHDWLDKNGWLHRNANVINRKNGKIYNLTIDIAKTKDGRSIMYATNGKIKKVGSVDVGSLKLKGPGQNSNFDTIISQINKNVNPQNSLSADEDLLPTRDYQIRGKDVALEEPLPIREDLKISNRSANADSQTSYTKDARSERLERKLKRIDKRLEREKAELVEEFKSIDPLAKEMFL